MAREALLSRVAIPEASVHRVPTELPSAAHAAEAYERELAAAFGLTPPAARAAGAGPAAAEAPGFDLILLGMGADGHTASLFPGADVLREERRWVAAPWVEKLAAYRVTLTYPVLDAAARVVFLIAGGDKAETLAQVAAADRGPDAPPAARVRPRGELIWLVDRAAAAALPP
jgi:6-phosphogluconolactonase